MWIHKHCHYLTEALDKNAQKVFGWDSAPDPTGQAYNTGPDIDDVEEPFQSTITELRFISHLT